MPGILTGFSPRAANLPGRCAMKKLDRINELVDELNELKLGCMAASLDSLYHTKSFDELDAVSLLEQMIGPEYQNKTSQRFQNRLKRAHLAGGPQSLDKCKDSTERVYLPSDINATLSSLDLSVKALMSVFSGLPTAENHI